MRVSDLPICNVQGGAELMIVQETSLNLFPPQVSAAGIGDPLGCLDCAQNRELMFDVNTRARRTVSRECLHYKI